MSTSAIAAWLSIGLSFPAARVLARRGTRAGGAALTVLYGVVAYGTLLVVPIQAEAALELLGLIDRITLLGPALVSTAVLLVDAARGRTAASLGRSESLASSVASVTSGLPGYVVTAGGVVAAVYALFALETLTGHPDSWDGISYHLPVVAGWLRQGSLALPADAHYYDAIPANADLLSLLTLATGWEGFTEAWNVLSAAAAVVGSYVLSRVIGVDRTGSAVGAIVVAGMPIVLYQTFSSYVDLFVAGFLVAGGALLAGFATGRGTSGEPRAAMVAAGLACGLAVGAKATAWPVVFLITAVVAVWLALARDHRGRPWALLVLFLGAVAAPGLFWFVRNYAATGNPAFPLEITVFGLTVFPGTSASRITVDPYGTNVLNVLLDWMLYPWLEPKPFGYPYSVGTGLGPLFASLAVPGGLYTIWTLCFDSHGASSTDRRRRFAVLAALAILVACWWFALSPLWRFGLPSLILACVLAAPFFQEFHRWSPNLLGTLLVAAAVLFGAIASLPAAQSVAHRLYHGEWDWADAYHLPSEFTSLPEDATVINYDVGGEGWNNFALLGPELNRRVVPDWKVEAAIEQGESLEVCSAYVVDRRPFQLRPGESLFDGRNLRLAAEAEARHGDSRWRIWRVDRGPCEGEAPTGE